MVIVGSNIARAFALVGAMSIVRFRNPIKDSRDLVFIFASIAVGMACGTKFYVFGGIFTFVFVAILFLMNIFGFGELPNKNVIFKIRINDADDGNVLRFLDANCQKYSIIAVDKLSREEGVRDVIYELEIDKDHNMKELIEKLQNEINPIRLNVITGQGNINV
jgi:uncharacterized membrane protein YhiD involved in acid resistance